MAIVGAALAVGFGGGGIGALGSLGQAFSGPDLPETAPLPRAGDNRSIGRLLAQVRRDNAPATAADGPTTVATVPTDDATGIPARRRLPEPASTPPTTRRRPPR